MPPRRKCVECPERDNYVASLRLKGLNEIGVRCAERYIDEFLKFRQEDSGHTGAKTIKKNELQEFAKHLNLAPVLKQTMGVKIRAVLNWLQWMTDQKIEDYSILAASDTNGFVKKKK